jgi:DNA-directed RNA polymerase subunit alpha
MLKPNFKTNILEEKPDYAKFSIEPLQQGYGHTVGNALRRCLLGSLPGAAITHIKIDGVQHQFSTLPGLKEDVVEFILNLKQIRFKYDGEKEVKAVLEAKGPGEITAKKIKLPAQVSIINKDLYLGHLADSKSRIKVQFWINTGLGYSPSEERESDTLGVIPIDAIFTPIVRVNYEVRPTRVGRRTDFDNLILEIWTDGTLKPKETLDLAAQTLVKFFKQVYNPVFKTEKKKTVVASDDEVMKLTVEELDLPTRIANALRRGGFETVKDLVKAKKSDIGKVKNLGKKSINTIYKKLKEKGAAVK